MIVVLINNLGVGGAERLVVDDINELYKRGIPARLILLSKTPSAHLEHELKIPADWIIRHHVGSIFDMASMIRLSKLLRTLKTRTVVTHLWFANTVGRLAAFMASISSVITFEHNIYDSVKTRKQFIIDRILQYGSKHIVAVSESVRLSLLSHGISDKKIVVVPNALPLERYRNAAPASLQSLGIPETTTVFIFIGRLIHQKAVDVLLKAFARVERAHLLIV